MSYMDICLGQNDPNMRMVAQEIQYYLSLKVCMGPFLTTFFSVILIIQAVFYRLR